MHSNYALYWLVTVVLCCILIEYYIVLDFNFALYCVLIFVLYCTGLCCISILTRLFDENQTQAINGTTIRQVILAVTDIQPFDLPSNPFFHKTGIISAVTYR